MNSFDLHCHSWFSDGTLCPADVVKRAASNNVRYLALTDHDTVSGLKEAQATAQELGIHLIPGIEISVSWNSKTLHVLGLNIQPDTLILQHAVAKIADIRFKRAQAIALDLEKAGIPHAWEGALQYAHSTDSITRTHFARFLVEYGAAPSLGKVYRHFLRPGKPGYAKATWLDLDDTIRIIHEAKGVAVLAHPGRYDLSATACKRLLGQFAELGGDGIEVITSNHTPEQTRYFTEHCLRLGLKASCGSDFHSPEESRIDLGHIASLPAGLTPIWSNWLSILEH